MVPAGRYLFGGQAEVAEGEGASLGPGVAELKLDRGGRPVRCAAVPKAGPPHPCWVAHLVHPHGDRLGHALKAECQLPASSRPAGNDRRPPAAKAPDCCDGGKDPLPRRLTGHLAHVTVAGDLLD